LTLTWNRHTYTSESFKIIKQKHSSTFIWSRLVLQTCSSQFFLHTDGLPFGAFRSRERVKRIDNILTTSNNHGLAERVRVNTVKSIGYCLDNYIVTPHSRFWHLLCVILASIIHHTLNIVVWTQFQPCEFASTNLQFYRDDVKQSPLQVPRKSCRIQGFNLQVFHLGNPGLSLHWHLQETNVLLNNYCDNFQNTYNICMESITELHRFSE